jgi:hypothetical protein
MQFQFEKEIIFYTVSVIFAVGILLRLILNGRYKSLIKQTENFGNCKNMFLKQIKLKFESNYRLNMGMNNIEVFVDRQLSKYKVMGTSLNQMENRIKLIPVLCIIAGAAGAAFGAYLQFGVIDLALMAGSGAVAAVVLAVFDLLLDISYKKELLVVCLCDYLENNLSPKLDQDIDDLQYANRQEQENLQLGTISGKIEKYRELHRLEKEISAMKEAFSQVAASREEEKGKEEQKKQERDEGIIEEVLNEFLG